GLLHILYSFLISQPAGFRAQSFSSFTGRACALTHEIGDRKLLIELAGLPPRRLLPFVELFLVVSHSNLAIQLLYFRRLVRRPRPSSSISSAVWLRPGR